MEGFLISTIPFCSKFQIYSPVPQVVKILFFRNNMARRCVSFPLNRASEVVLYSVRDGPIWNRRAKLEVMQIGSTRPATIFDIFVDFLIILCSALLMLILLIPIAVAIDKGTLVIFSLKSSTLWVWDGLPYCLAILIVYGVYRLRVELHFCSWQLFWDFWAGRTKKLSTTKMKLYFWSKHSKPFQT